MSGPQRVPFHTAPAGRPTTGPHGPPRPMQARPVPMGHPAPRLTPNTRPSAPRGYSPPGRPAPHGNLTPSRSPHEPQNKLIEIRNRAWAILGAASLFTVAIVPGAAMAAGALTVAADAYCSYGSFCLYSEPNFNGKKVEYSHEELFCQDSHPALDVATVLPQGARSIVNNTRTETSGLGVKIYGANDHLVLTTVNPGEEKQDLRTDGAEDPQSLCAFPKS